MALAEVTDSALSLGKGSLTQGATIEGYYNGPETVSTKKHGDRLIHGFTTREGEVVITVWGSAQLDRRLKNVRPHQFTRVTYLGTAPSANGQDMHVVRVEADKDDIDPASATQKALDEIPF